MAGPDTNGSIALDVGSGGGGHLDVTDVTYGSAPTTRKRDRVVIGGDQAAELADVLNDEPSTTTYGLVTRNIPHYAGSIGGRTHIQKNLAAQTASAVVHTVTATKTFHLVTLFLSWFNSSITTNGQIEIRDGAATTVIPFVLPIGATASISPASPGGAVTLGEPILFTSDLRVTVVSGTILYSIAIAGYEE